MALILGLESSCDDSAVALVTSDRRILAQRVVGQNQAHAPFGGVVPEIAARAHVEVLPGLVREVLAEAIEAGGSSLRDHRQASGELGYFQDSFRVYGREGQPCRRQGCGGTIRRIVQGGRSTWYCPACQR